VISQNFAGSIFPQKALSSRPVTSYESTESVESVRFFVKKFKTGRLQVERKQILNEIYSISDEG
jgi:hypothetical protein